MLEPPCFTLGSTDLHSFLDIELVKRKHSHASLRRGHTHVLHEFLHSWEIRQGLGITHQMEEGDQGMRLAPAVGEFELANSLIALPCQAHDHVLSQLAQVEGRVSEREKLTRLLVDRPRFPHHHVVQVSSKNGERELSRFEIIPDLQDFMPRRPW